MYRSITLIFLFLTQQIVAQELPYFASSRSDLSDKIELVEISYHNNYGYQIDDSERFYTSKKLGEKICEKIYDSDFNNINFENAYATLRIDKNSPISILDSIFCELRALNILNLRYLTSYSDSSGINLRITPESLTVKFILKEHNKYYPENRDIIGCLKIEDENDIPLVAKMKRPYIDNPIDLLEIIDADSVYNGKRVHLISFQNDTFKINGTIKDKNNADKKVQEAIVIDECIFIIEMEKSNNYNDYLSMIDLIIRNIYVTRDRYQNKSFPLIILNYTLTEKRCMKMNYNR